MQINTHHLIIPFGKHKGLRLTRVPFEYLRWMAVQPFNENFTLGGLSWAEIAKAELERRGTPDDTAIMPSHHAIDRFSTKHLKIWDNRSKGIASFLTELSMEAWKDGKEVETQPSDAGPTVSKLYGGMKFVFLCDQDGKPHTLKTVI